MPAAADRTAPAAAVLLAVAGAALALHPLLAAGAAGLAPAWLAAMAVSLRAWRRFAEQAPDHALGLRYAAVLLAASATIAPLGALRPTAHARTIAQDLEAAALATLAGLHRRGDVSADERLWLFALALPVERGLGRLGALALRQGASLPAADVAAGLVLALVLSAALGLAVPGPRHALRERPRY